MNTTKTMRLPPRRLITPRPRPNKRRGREGLDDDEAHPKPPPSNQLLAGYLAHEFLASGTLLGQPWPSASLPQSRAEPSQMHNYQAYVEVAHLLKQSGAHFEGIVNPSQLARLLHL